jgi:alkanesulfonate monooxygenase SsuD/methylene tetrahydromethanopterin reductase-like flavin-dependent oxidoreductase (luciferase family)
MPNTDGVLDQRRPSTRCLTVAATIRPHVAPEKMAAAGHAAEAAGLDEVWLWEDCFFSGGLTTAAMILSQTSTLKVGVGVLPVPMRSVALTAMEIATLYRAFPGRVRIGVGHGVQEWMAQIGENVASPMTLLREHLECLSMILRGDRVSYAGRYVKLRDVCLEWPPLSPVEIVTAATGPRTLQLSGELAAGTVLTSETDPDQVRDAIANIQIGVARRNLPAVDHSVIVYVQTATGHDAERSARDELSRWDFDQSRFNDLTAYGDAEQIAGSVRRWIDAGADTIVLQHPVDVDIEAFVTFAGTEVQPLLKR